MSFIAPQAYTKETLAKAFDWLQHQPTNLKQVATSPDVLVGLYLKAQRQGITNIDADAPVSSKRFIDDLKNLKKDMALFDEPKSRPLPTPISSPQPALSIEPTDISHQSTQAPPVSFPTSAIFNQSEPASPSYTMTSIQQTQTIQQTSVQAARATDLNLDDETMNHLVNIQKRFNLSSPQEALRMAISVGAQQISRWT